MRKVSRSFLLLSLLLSPLLSAGCGDAKKEPPPAMPASANAPVEPPPPVSMPDVSQPAEERGGFRPMATGMKPPAAATLNGSLEKGAGAATTGSAQLSLMNQTGITLDLYVDDGYGCRALKNLMCTTQVSPGFHNLRVEGPNGETLPASYTFDEGESVTWTVTSE